MMPYSLAKHSIFSISGLIRFAYFRMTPETGEKKNTIKLWPHCWRAVTGHLKGVYGVTNTAVYHGWGLLAILPFKYLIPFPAESPLELFIVQLSNIGYVFRQLCGHGPWICSCWKSCPVNHELVFDNSRIKQLWSEESSFAWWELRHPRSLDFGPSLQWCRFLQVQSTSFRFSC